MHLLAVLSGDTDGTVQVESAEARWVLLGGIKALRPLGASRNRIHSKRRDEVSRDARDVLGRQIPSPPVKRGKRGIVRSITLVECSLVHRHHHHRVVPTVVRFGINMALQSRRRESEVAEHVQDRGRSGTGRTIISEAREVGVDSTSSIRAHREVERLNRIERSRKSVSDQNAPSTQGRRKGS